MLSLTNYYRLSYGAFGVHLMLCSTSSLSLQNCKHIKLQFSYHAGFIEACSAVWNFQGVLCHPYLSLHLYDILNDTNVRGFVIGATNALFQQKANLTDVVVEVGNSTSYLLQFHSFMIRLPVSLLFCCTLNLQCLLCTSSLNGSRLLNAYCMN